MAQQSKKTTARKAPRYSSDTMALRYIVGLVLVAAGGLMFMATAMAMEGTVFEAVRSFAYGLAGSLAVALPVLPVWGGVLMMVSAQRKAPLRAYVYVLLLFLFVLTAVTLMCQTRGAAGTVSLMDYFHETNKASSRSPAGYDLFLYRGYELGRDRHLGGGLLGMLLSWPLWRLAGAVPGCVIAVVLAVGDVVLLFRKEISQLVRKARERGEQRRQMSEREQADIRAREMQWRMQQEQPPYQQPPYQQMPPPYQPQQYPPQPQPAPVVYGGYQQAMADRARGVRVGFQPTGRERYEQMSPDVIRQESEAYTSSLREERRRNRTGKLRMPQLFSRKKDEQPAGDQRSAGENRPAHTRYATVGQRFSETAPAVGHDSFRRPEAAEKAPEKRVEKPADAVPEHRETAHTGRSRRMADWQMGEEQPQMHASRPAAPVPEASCTPPATPADEPDDDAVQPVRTSPAYEMKPEPAQDVHPVPVRQPQPEPVAEPQPASAYEPEREPAPEPRRRLAHQSAPAKTPSAVFAAPAEQPKAVVQEEMVIQPAEKPKPKMQTPWQRALQEKKAQAAGVKAEAPADDTPPWEEKAQPSQEPAMVVPKVQKPAPKGVWQPELNLPPRKDPEEASEASEPERPYVYPPLSLLREPAPYADEADDADRERIEALETLLHNFNYPARVVHITHGPRLSRYELEVEEGILLNRISNLEENILAKMSVPSINIQTPIPGTSLVGVEIPNRKSQIVTLREVLESPEMRQSKSPLTIALGRDIGGKPVICDITRMPHMLIAGKTKSGKSVCINTLINSIVFRASPKEVRMILVDPKVVELKRYNTLPHLLLPVITEMSKAAAALEWAVAEMMERYNRLAERDVPNIDEYNASLTPGEESMPYILIIIDEMADLMMQHGKNVEGSIMRLAQLARAAGIHLVLATQRPVVKYISGSVKANINGRVAFKTESALDSATILDGRGAEKLLGNGDMIFKCDDGTLRAQGCFISTNECREILSFIAEHNPVQYDPNIVEHLEQESGIRQPGAKTTADQENIPGVDPVLIQAIELAVQEGQVSSSLLSRRFRLGYNRAARITEEMEARGVIGPLDGAKPRMCLITPEQFEAMKEQLMADSQA